MPSHSGEYWRKLSWQAPGSYSLAKLFEPKQVGSERLPVSEFRGPVTSLSIEKIQQAGCTVPVGVLADVAGLFRLVQKSGAIKSHHLIIGAQILKGVSHVGLHLPIGESLLLLRLRYGVGGARNLTLVAIENRHLHLSEQGNVVEVTQVGVVHFPSDVSLADRLLQSVLAVGGGDPLRCCPQVGPVLQRERLKVVHVALDRLVIERPGYVVVRCDRFVSQQLA